MSSIDRKIVKPQYIASISYGKDSLAMLEIIHRNNLPLDRIIHAEIMATSTIHADLPPMVEFKDKADKIIYEKYGLNVERLVGARSYEDIFYMKYGERSKFYGKIYGFPTHGLNWCNSMLKIGVLQKCNRQAFKYIGIAADEAHRKKIDPKKIYPLIDYDISEQWCYDWCKENGLLSPIYENSTRSGCWFCYLQTIGSLKTLRKDYPEYWKLLLKWDADSPLTFKTNGKTIRYFDKRFAQEELQLSISDIQIDPQFPPRD